MYPAPIENYVAPATVQEALTALGAQAAGEAHFLAGGQSLMQAVKSRLISPRTLIDLQHVAELKGISAEAGGVRIGAMTRYRGIAAEERLNGAYEALRDAASHVGDRQVRNRGTIGGSLCWNYLAACMPPTCIGLGASVELLDTKGEKRTLPAEEFLRGPLETARKENEILLAVVLPGAPPKSGSAYKKWGLVTDALPVIGVCAFVQIGDDGRCRRARLAVGGLATGPRRSKAGEEALAGVAATDADAIAAAADRAAASTEVQADMWADISYRKALISALAREVIATAFGRAQARRAA
jgi:aerobic carbon-monoxide dehydrogenase medium subunit